VSGLAGADTAKPDKKACFEAHEKGQRERGQGKLKDAATLFTLCASESCPAVAREECGKWLTDLKTAIPSVVLLALDAKGRDLTDLTVDLDGQPLADRLDGRAVQIDPGEHTFTFQLPDGTSLEVKHVLAEGDARRRIVADFSTLKPKKEQPPPAAKPVSRPVPLGTWILGGVGVAALGGFTYFALSGKSQENDLKDRCAPNCSDSEVTVMDQRYLAADISLGVSLVSLGVATYLFATRKPAKAAPTSAALEFVPTTPGAGVVRWTTRF
jgi:hypothetical protein